MVYEKIKELVVEEMNIPHPSSCSILLMLDSQSCRSLISIIHLTLGTRADLEPQRGGKAVTVLPLVISRLHDNRKYSHATPPEFDDGNPTLLHAVMHEMFLCTCFERS